MVIYEPEINQCSWYWLAVFVSSEKGWRALVYVHYKKVNICKQHLIEICPSLGLGIPILFYWIEWSTSVIYHPSNLLVIVSEKKILL